MKKKNPGPDGLDRGGEIRMLVHAARAGLDLPTQDEPPAELPPDDFDWEWFRRTAQRNGILPLVHAFANNSPRGRVPQSVRVRLVEECRRVAHRNLLLASQLIRICDLLRSAGIPAMPYKGPVLAVSAYGDISLRQYADLDILIRQRDVLAARDLLIGHEYRPRRRLTAAEERALLRTECEYVLEHEQHRFLVELHWGIATRRLGFPLVLEQIEDRLRPLELCGGTVMTAPPEESLLILCVHGSRHLWRRFAWICDVAAVVGADPGPDWERLIGLAERSGSERMLCLGLALARGVLGAPLPERVLSRIRADRTTEALAAEVMRDLFLKTDPPIPMGELWRFQMRLQNRYRGKLGYVFDVAVRPRVEDCAVVSLPISLYPSYYIIRPFRLAVQYGFGALKRVFRKDASEQDKA